MVDNISNQRLFTFLVFALILTTHFSTQIIAQPGTLDLTFGTNGILTASLDSFSDKANAVVIQDDGKIILGGSTQSSYTTADFALIRYNTDGTLDNTFGTNGQVITTIENRSKGYAVTLQNDGKILLGGSSKFFINIARYHTDGNLDTTFGNGGKVITDVIGYYSETCKSVAIQNDGKILVGGYGQESGNDNPYFMIVRYLENGTQDPTFGTNGVVIGDIGVGHSIQVQNDGKILLGGSSNLSFAIERYTNNGILDNTFGTNGKVTTQFGNSNSYGHSMQLQNDGKIILGGYSSWNTVDMALARYNTDGTLDNTFGVNGRVITPFGNSSKGNAIAIQNDGKIILGGHASNNANALNFALLRYNIDGTLDNTFGTDGKTLTPIGISYSIGQAIDINSDGKVVLAGVAYIDSNLNIAVTRYHGDPTIGIKENITTDGTSSIYPNPFSAFTTIHINTPVQHADLTIYNANGEMVSQKNNIGGQDIQFYRNHLPNGVYFFQLKENDNIVTAGKLMINSQ